MVVGTRSLLVAFGLLAVAAFALPHHRPLSSSGLLHSQQQKEVSAKRGWKYISPAQGHEDVNLVIALKHRNMDVLRGLWWDIANPQSPKYGKFLSQEQIDELTSPDVEAVPAVTAWLQAHGASSIEVTNPASFVKAKISASGAEQLLGVKLHHFAPVGSARSVLRSLTRVQVPSALQDYVDLVSGVSDFSRPWRQSKQANRLERAKRTAAAAGRGDADTIPPTITFLDNGNHEIEIQAIPQCTYVDVYGNTCNSTSFKHEIAGFDVEVFSQSVSHKVHFNVDDVYCEIDSDSAGEWVQQCSLPVTNVTNWVKLNVSIATVFKNGHVSDKTYTPALVVCGPWAFPHVIKQLYNVTAFAGELSSDKSTSGVILFEYQYYSPSDLVTFLNATLLPADAAAVVAPTDQNDPTQPGDEGQADIELISANGVGGKHSTYWYSGDRGDGVLEWALQIANVSDADVPKVWSLSWGISETAFDDEVGPGTQTRINDELAKMGVRGITVVVASGDAGLRDVGRSEFDCGVFEPSFPASSPYVVSVSATMLVPGEQMEEQEQVPTEADLPICKMHMDGTGAGEVLSCDETGLSAAVEVAVSCCSYGAVWTTGGGFSNNYTRVQWQGQAVQGYIQSQSKLPPSSFWNISGRAYPDISVVGDKVPTVLNGDVDNFGGTSAASPIAAGLISLLNAARVSVGKGLLGPVGPLLYQLAAEHPNAFRDITVGDNRCGELMCCDEGFECAVGWDPVTGLGSPNVGVLRDLVLALP